MVRTKDIERLQRTKYEAFGGYVYSIPRFPEFNYCGTIFRQNYLGPFFIARVNGNTFKPKHELTVTFNDANHVALDVSKHEGLYYEYGRILEVIKNGKSRLIPAYSLTKINVDSKLKKVIFHREFIPNYCLRLNLNGKIIGKVTKASILRTILFDRVYGQFIVNQLQLQNSIQNPLTNEIN